MNLKVRNDAGMARKEDGRQRLLGAVLWMLVGCLFTGATAASTNLLAILTPIAVVAVMALGAAAWFNKISWGWAIAAMVGVALVFGSQQIVTWIRGMFGV